ncbi:MAG: cobalamin biosynthesis protein [Chloroflexi bacterium]|nr:cobalamin biosynthesis protein [Chloroflexota bacterium]
MENIAVLALALALDMALGEPPNRFHPVAWLGKLISLEDRVAPRAGSRRQLAYGLAVVVVDVLLFALPAYYLMRYLGSLSPVTYALVGTLLLKVSFSARFLTGSAARIRNLLEADRLGEARFSLRSLVSRDTSALDKPGMVSATIESVAENMCDSFVAPIFYFIIFGLPGALAYRAVNTLDAMIGYHGEYEYLGKAAARLDDALNYVPARTTALLIVVAAFVVRRGSNALRILRRDHGQTESPNAGWPMSAMAGGLGVQLEKVGFYRLGDEEAKLAPRHIGASIRFMYLTVFLWLAISLTVVLVRYAYFS